VVSQRRSARASRIHLQRAALEKKFSYQPRPLAFVLGSPDSLLLGVLCFMRAVRLPGSPAVVVSLGEGW